jgi:hypothetical protein
VNWRGIMAGNPAVKSVPKIKNRNWRKIISCLKPILRNIEVIFNLIDDRGLNEETESEKNIIETAFELMNYRLKKHISEKIGRKINNMNNRHKKPKRTQGKYRSS